MSTGPTTMSENRPQDHGARRHWFPRLRDAKIRSKLALILVVPVAAVLALASVRLVAIVEGAYQANTVRALTALSIDISTLTQDVHKERMAAAALLASPGQKSDSYNLAVRRTDERVAAYHDERKNVGDVPRAIQDRLGVIDDHLSTLNTTRQDVLDHRQMPVAQVILRYGVILTDLVEYADVVGQTSGEGLVGDSLRAAAAFSRAKAATAEQEAVTFAGLADGKLDEEQFSALVATLTSQQEALLAFSLVATPDQRELVNNTVTGDAVVLADRVSAEVLGSVGQRTASVTAPEAARTVAAVTDLMRWSEIQLMQRVLVQADQVSSDVAWQAILESVLVLVTLVLAIALAVVLARSLNRALRRLREGALAVANHDLPDAVSRLRDMRSVSEGGVEEIVRQVRDPIRLPNRDEIGQVALAFNVVHKEAVRIAAEQAALRTSVSAMFLNLARRSQALVDRMIGELDTIERSEEDPKRLARLFELDHLATRMRRNDENLLVLAGADSTAPRRDDALLVDSLRAAQSEVELYNRIEFSTVDTDISVAAHAVNDVVRLVAELLDNATRFSPPQTVVVADARRIRDYVLIQVEDRGLGMTDEQLETLNHRLATPSSMDVAAFRLMGLAVVSRLASRYGIRVELRRNLEGGTVAQVTLPSSIVVLPAVRGREIIAVRPRQPLAVEQAPAAAAPLATWPDPNASTPTGRTSAATLADEWRVATPAGWDAPVERPINGSPVGPAVWAAADQVQTAPPAVPLAQQPRTNTNAGTNTVAYPTLSRPEQTVVAGMPATTRPLSPVLPPTAGLPSGPVAGMSNPVSTAAPATMAGPEPAAGPGPEDGAEMPIFREMEAVWFRTHGQDATQIFTIPAGGYASPPPSAAATSGPSDRIQARAPLPSRTPGESAPAEPVSTPVTAPAPAVPAPPGGAWRTAADEGWARANKAAEPVNAGSTRSGLPRRVPQAQLVPGGVESKAVRQHKRRTPDEVRGLLSAYHRGVQRGRSAGSAPNISTKETSE